MHAQTKTHNESRGTKVPRDHQMNNTMIKVMTSRGFDFIKSSLLNYYIKSGYVLALA
jgi:hypothetical protein